MIFKIKELKKSFKYLQDNGFTIIEDVSYIDEPLFYYNGKHGDGKNY